MARSQVSTASNTLYLMLFLRSVLSRGWSAAASDIGPDRGSRSWPRWVGLGESIRLPGSNFGETLDDDLLRERFVRPLVAEHARYRCHAQVSGCFA